jgi:hypothetical protein
VLVVLHCREEVLVWGDNFLQLFFVKDDYLTEVAG